MKRLCLSALFALALSVGAVAQSSGFMDGLLGAKEASFGQLSYLVLAASDRLGAEADQAGAFKMLQDLGWAPKAARADDPMTLASYAYILMRAFDMKGGILYSLFPSPRYAYREFVSRSIVQGRSDPLDPVDGASAIRILGSVSDNAGAGG
jgi:hypothetical protein